MKQSMKKGVVAGVMALTALSSVPVTHAQTQSNADLNAQIQQLLKTISDLQARIGQPSTANNSSFANYTWTRSLKVGMTGEDVRMLQRLLNSNSETRVAVSGVGSIGNETTYFGPATQAAVMKFQTKYRSEVLTPGGLTAPTGFFGPASIAKANVLAKSGGGTTTPTPEPGDDKPELSGEGTLGTFTLDDASDTDVKEASADAEIAELTLEARDGDIRINRMDFSLVANSGNTEKDPWDVFEEISLWVDGDKIAEKSLDNKSDYLNRNLGTFRFTNVDLVLEEDEEVEIIVAASLKNNVDGAGSAATWTVSPKTLRYFDADGVASTESSLGDLGDSASFDIVERGEGEELKFALSDKNPAASTIVVDDSKKTTNETILEYTIEAIDADIELDRLYVNIQTGTAPFSSVIDDVRLVVGGKTFKDAEILTTGIYSATNTRVMFDIDGDVTIDDGDKETVKVIVDFKPQTGYQNNESVIARITSVERDLTKAEGSDDIEKLSGTVIGKEHRLIGDGVMVNSDSVSFKTETQGENDTIGIFTLKFEVSAVEGDFYFKDLVSTSSSASTGGIKVSVDSTVGAPTSVSGVLDTTAREDSNGVFTIREGRTETITVTVVVDAANAGQHRVSVDSLFFSDNTDGLTNARTYSLTPTNEFRSPYRFIQN